MKQFVIKNLYTSIDAKEILHGISLTIRAGEVHAVMGPNGGGKSTLASALMGHPAYQVRGKVALNGTNIISLSTEKRAQAGLFLAFQSPVAIPGVTVMNLLRESYQMRFGKKKGKEQHIHNPALRGRGFVGAMPVVRFADMVRSLAQKLSLEEQLLRRGIHDGFSGGERKKVEMLEALVLQPAYAIFDEIDTGLDVDALKSVAYGLTELARRGTGVIIITHYQRILRFVKPDYVHVLVSGKIVKTGNASLAKEIESKGYGVYNI